MHYEHYFASVSDNIRDVKVHTALPPPFVPSVPCYLSLLFHAICPFCPVLSVPSVPCYLSPLFHAICPFCSMLSVPSVPCYLSPLSRAICPFCPVLSVPSVPCYLSLLSRAICAAAWCLHLSPPLGPRPSLSYTPCVILSLLIDTPLLSSSTLPGQAGHERGRIGPADDGTRPSRAKGETFRHI
jgi:hypothetical protein